MDENATLCPERQQDATVEVMAEPLNKAIELHDSVLGSLFNSGTTVRLVMEPAYVHESAGRPGIDPGLGFVQNFVLEIEGGLVEGQVGVLPAEVFHGSIQMGTEVSDNVFALPINPSGPVRLTLHLAPDNRRISIAGNFLIARAISDPVYVEKFLP
jgi:hypothetical protein